MTLRLTTVDDLLAGWSWEASPTPNGYIYVVKDPNGNEWGNDSWVGYQQDNRDNGIGGYYCNLALAWEQTDQSKWTYDEYVAKHRFELEEHKNRKVRKYGEYLVKRCIKNYLKYRVHPVERPTIGVTYVGSQRQV